MAETAQKMSPAMRGEGQFLQALVAYLIHQDGLFWNQIRTLLVFQGAAIPASYFLFPNIFCVGVMAIALVLTLYMQRVTTVMRHHRDANVYAIDQVSHHIVHSTLAGINRGTE